MQVRLPSQTSQEKNDQTLLPFIQIWKYYFVKWPSRRGCHIRLFVDLSGSNLEKVTALLLTQTQQIQDFSWKMYWPIELGANCTIFWSFLKINLNKKVLLRECKRHTACPVASARYAALCNGGVPQVGGTPSQVGAYPISALRGAPHLRSGWGTPSQVGVPNLRSGRVPHLRSGGTPSQVGVYPGYPLPIPEMGVPPYPDLRWGTPASVNRLKILPFLILYMWAVIKWGIDKTVYNSGSCLLFWVLVLCFRFVVSDLISERQLIHTPTWNKLKIYSNSLLIYNFVSPKNSNIPNKFSKIIKHNFPPKIDIWFMLWATYFCNVFFVMWQLLTKKCNTLLCITAESNLFFL